MFSREWFLAISLAAPLAAQAQPARPPSGAQGVPPRPAQTEGWRSASESTPGEVTVSAGTRVPLALINSVSTKHSAQGDRVYLQTVFPILVNNRIVIPAGSYVLGTVTEVKRPGRVKGRGELWVRFDSLTLPNGVTRDFRARLGGVDGLSDEELDRKEGEGKVVSDSNKGGDARTIVETAAAGGSIGVVAGAAAQHVGMGAGIGAAAGAAAGMLGVLLTRGPDAVLAKGSTIEMVLDRNVTFESADLNFGNYQPPPPPSPSAEPAPAKTSGLPLPGRLPF
jgi:type IV secretion system protein VirB10